MLKIILNVLETACLKGLLLKILYAIKNLQSTEILRISGTQHMIGKSFLFSIYEKPNVLRSHFNSICFWNICNNVM